MFRKYLYLVSEQSLSWVLVDVMWCTSFSSLIVAKAMLIPHQTLEWIIVYVKMFYVVETTLRSLILLTIRILWRSQTIVSNLKSSVYKITKLEREHIELSNKKDCIAVDLTKIKEYWWRHQIQWPGKCYENITAYLSWILWLYRGNTCLVSENIFLFFELFKNHFYSFRGLFGSEQEKGNLSAILQKYYKLILSVNNKIINVQTPHDVITSYYRNKLIKSVEKRRTKEEGGKLH